jgi:spore coat polysaccharide biosynthesis protein SpsF (cytidylyltransferase family)
MCNFRVLLQRITGILTAPPTVTDEDYKRMKKLVCGLKSVEKLALKSSEKRNKEFFERIHNTEAYYNPKEWEEEYKRQVSSQIFNNIIHLFDY